MDGKTLVSSKDKTLAEGDLESRRPNSKMLVTGKVYCPAYPGSANRGQKYLGPRKFETSYEFLYAAI